MRTMAAAAAVGAVGDQRDHGDRKTAESPAIPDKPAESRTPGMPANLETPVCPDGTQSFSTGPPR